MTLDSPQTLSDSIGRARNSEFSFTFVIASFLSFSSQRQNYARPWNKRGFFPGHSHPPWLGTATLFQGELILLLYFSATRRRSAERRGETAALFANGDKSAEI